MDIAASVAQRAVNEQDLELPIDIIVLSHPKHLLGVLIQQLKEKGEKKRDVKVLEWVFGPMQPCNSIQPRIDALALLIPKGRKCIVQVTGEEPQRIFVPVKQTDLDWFLQHSPELQASILESGAEIKLSPLSSPILRWMSSQTWLSWPKYSETPLTNAVTIFTDAGRKPQKSALTWNEQGQWNHILIEG